MKEADNVANESLGTMEEFFARVKAKAEAGDTKEFEDSQMVMKKYIQREGLPVAGDEMRDTNLAHLDGTEFKLSEKVKPGRPLVLNFGSYVPRSSLRLPAAPSLSHGLLTRAPSAYGILNRLPAAGVPDRRSACTLSFWTSCTRSTVTAWTS
jgi:hypothetical protein